MPAIKTTAKKKSSHKPSAKKAVWDNKNPVEDHKHLTASQKETAKKRAAKAGRPYPNMVDNIAVAKGEGSSSPASRKRAPAKPSAKSPTDKATAKKPATKKAQANKATVKKPEPKKTAVKPAARKAAKT